MATKKKVEMVSGPQILGIGTAEKVKTVAELANNIDNMAFTIRETKALLLASYQMEEALSELTLIV